MAKALFYNEISSTRASVISIHNQPDLLSEEKKNQTFMIDDADLPDKPTLNAGETCNLFFNPETGELWYEVQERPLTDEEEKIKDLEDRVAYLEGELSK